MKTYLVIFVLLSSSCLNRCFAQKPPVSLDTYKSWQKAIDGDLSRNGRFALYSVINKPEGNRTLYVKTTSGKALLSLENAREGKFSSTSEQVIVLLPKDTLMVYDLSSGSRFKVSDVQDFKLLQWLNREQIFIRTKNGEFRIINFRGKRLFQMPDILDYKVLTEQRAILAVRKDSEKKNIKLLWVNQDNGDSTILYSGKGLIGLITDRSNRQLAFVPVGIDNKIGYYSKGMDSAILIDIKTDLSFTPGQYWRFTDDGTQLLFSLNDNSPDVKRENSLNVEVWNYQDQYLQSYYNGTNDLGKNIKPKSCLGALTIVTRESKQLTSCDQIVINGSLQGNYCIVESNANIRSGNWQNGLGRSYFLCSIKTGEIIPMKENEISPSYLWSFSPSGRFVAYYDQNTGDYLCYDIAERRTRKISEGITTGLIRYDKLYYPNPKYHPVGISGWLQNDAGVLIQGTYDIWRADPLGKQDPINLTGGEGQKHRTIFFPALGNDRAYRSDEKILLTAFDLKTKDLGFYTASLSSGNQLKELSHGNYYIEDVHTSLKPSMMSISENGYLVRMERSNSSPNYYFSKELKSFTAISDVGSQLNWNWVTAELHTYKDSLGNELQGILYKPENFDPNKKYPVIFGVYELQTNHLNSSLRPDPAGAMFSIPIMVSGGYTVFLPDVKAVPEFGGDGLTRSIVAAADHLAKSKWIDSTKMAIAGHSIGGFVTNYAVTHCDRFKAAISGAGISNMISASTDLFSEGAPMQEFLKDCVFMMKDDLLENVNAYIRNSPILSAKNLKTPLLLVHNDKDGAVRYEQSRSFFIILRNLNKPCWWLNYKGKNHHVSGSQEQLDYNIKVRQFFDHFLKGASVPDWMKEHI